MARLMTSAWPGQRDDGGLLLPLPFNDFVGKLPAEIALDATTLVRKPEVHATVLNRAIGSAARGSLGDARLRGLFEAFDWTPVRTGNALLLRKRKQATAGTIDAWSLVELIDLPAMSQFRTALGDALGQPLPDALPHVTLHTAGDHDGIGLPDMEAVVAFTVATLKLPGIANRTPPPLPAGLEAAYAGAEYRLGDDLGVIARIGDHSGDVDALLARHHCTRALVLTAFNPFSAPNTTPSNHLRQALLENDLREMAVAFSAAEGRDPSGQWPPERSVVAFGTHPALEAALLRDYEQHAAVLLCAGEAASLLMHPNTARSQQT